MLKYNSQTFYDEFFVFWLCFFPQFWLILHLRESQRNADPLRIRIRIRTLQRAHGKKATQGINKTGKKYL
jgi:hypothetical protein